MLGATTEHLLATSVDLVARINPRGFATTYRFEYGRTPEYGSSAPIPDGSIGSGTTPEQVVVHLEGLEEAEYHFRVVAENKWGQSVSEDQTFTFNPPSCPNAAVRQQTGASYIPDCRAYELVSAANSGGSHLTAEGPWTPYASNPGRFAYMGMFNAVPDTGDPQNNTGDLYVASRGDDGWTSRHVGIPATENIQNTGPPDVGYRGAMFVNRGLTAVLSWSGSVAALSSNLAESYAPYAWSSDGSSLGRLADQLRVGAGEHGIRLRRGIRGRLPPLRRLQPLRVLVAEPRLRGRRPDLGAGLGLRQRHRGGTVSIVSKPRAAVTFRRTPEEATST